MAKMVMQMDLISSGVLLACGQAVFQCQVCCTRPDCMGGPAPLRPDSDDARAHSVALECGREAPLSPCHVGALRTGELPVSAGNITEDMSKALADMCMRGCRYRVSGWHQRQRGCDAGVRQFQQLTGTLGARLAPAWHHALCAGRLAALQPRALRWQHCTGSQASGFPQAASGGLR